MSTASSTTSLKVLVLVGPTASGKTALLDALFGAGRRPGLPSAEVISADSMQAYRGMDIGTAKPGAALRARLPHRLIDILDPGEQYTAGDFVRLADEACARVAAAGGLPVVSGGTGFYVRNFVCGLPSAPAADPATRAAVARDLARLGREALRAELAAADPASAARIHPNDEYRITRAVEIVRVSGGRLGDFAPGIGPRAGFDFMAVAVERPRGELYARIDRRVDEMFAAGLETEVRALLEAGFGPASPGMKAIGYREFLDAPPGATADETAARIKLDTRRYAKRQETCFRGLPGLRRIGPDPDALLALALELLAR